MRVIFLIKSKNTMRILLSNDDSIHTRGIQQLAVTLRHLATVQIVAPDRDRSGAPNSLTLDAPLRIGKILNVNLPDLPLSSIKGCKVTHCGSRHPASEVTRQTDPRGREMLWIGQPAGSFDEGPGTDFEAVSQGCVSLTPMQVDLTANATIPMLCNWLVNTEEGLAPW